MLTIAAGWAWRRALGPCPTIVPSIFGRRRSAGTDSCSRWLPSRPSSRVSLEGRMQIQFVNHASFVCEHKDVRLLCDPWLYGSAFNDGWDLIVESRFSADQFADVNYIWFSHEHPDHFSPRVLSDVPAELRPRITVLYKQTTDQKVLNFCRKLGFITREL